jgi:hypothetical protein
MAEIKTKPTRENASDFLSRITDDQRRTDCLVLLDMMKTATGAEPVMWGESIVGFGSYRYRYESGRQVEWFTVGFSPRKSDLTLYLMPYSFDRFQDLLSGLGKHRLGKGCLYIKRLADVNQVVLQELIEQTVQVMSAQRGGDRLPGS